MALKLRRGTDLERQSVIFDEGELIYTTDTKILWVGDGQTLGGIKVADASESPIALTRDLDLNTFLITGAGDIDITGSISASSFFGDGSGLSNLSIFDTNTQYKIDILSSDGSSILLDSNTNSLNGDVYGNLTGNVYNDLDELMVDAATGTVYASIVTSTLSSDISKLTYGNGLPNTTNEFRISSDNNRSVLRLTRTSTGDMSAVSEAYGGIYFDRIDSLGSMTTGLILGRPDSIILVSDPNGSFDPSTFVTVYNGGLLGVGTANPTESLDVRGNAKVEGFVQFGSLTTTERNALTAANGMVIYNSTTNRFQGYQNGSWINIDDGTAA
jgi:hypothetical protein